MKRSHPSSPTSNDDDQESPSSSSTQSLRFMVHAVDGAVPYLTPHLLQACFQTKDYHDVLSIGIAVRDTCIVPIFHETSKKARGYTFSSETQVDAWLRPTERQPAAAAIEAAATTTSSYHCITVPSFDLWQDVLDTNNNVDTSLETPKHQQKEPKKEQPKQKQQQKQPKQQQQLSVTDKHVAVWTVNGRHVLTPEAYVQASRSLHSNTTLQLYDMIPPTTMTQQQQQPKQQLRRRLVALSRNEKWLAATAALDHDADDCHNNHSSLKQIWAAALPLADTNSDKTLEYTSILTRSNNNNNNNNNNKKITGVALVGWQHVPDATLQTESIQALVKAVHDIRNNNATTASPLTDIAVLSTTSLDQILKCAAAGCTVIGSHLPETWARKKKAFLIPTTSTSNNRKRMRTNDDNNNKSSSDDPALEQLDSNGCFDLTPTSEDSDVKRQHVWARDTRPLFPGSNGDDACTCFTCQTHTRAYLYHLVCAKELLADMLLFIHNLHHMLKLFRAMNKARAEYRIEALIGNIRTSLKE